MTSLQVINQVNVSLQYSFVKDQKKDTTDTTDTTDKTDKTDHYEHADDVDMVSPDFHEYFQYKLNGKRKRINYSGDDGDGEPPLKRVKKVDLNDGDDLIQEEEDDDDDDDDDDVDDLIEEKVMFGHIPIDLVWQLEEDLQRQQYINAVQKQYIKILESKLDAFSEIVNILKDKWEDVKQIMLNNNK